MRLKSGAAARVEHSTNIGEGLTIRLDTQDTSKETPLVANVLAKASLFLTGLQAGHTFIIDEAGEPGAIPGDAGFRVTVREDGSEVRTRFFAVTFAHTFYNRFV